MKFLHGKSVLLGIGIGIILTSIIGLVYFSGIQGTNNETFTYNSSKPAYVDEDYINIQITEADDFKTVSEELLKGGLIQNKLEFQVKVMKTGLQDKIKVGEYKIKKGTSQEEIIRMITGQ